MGCGIYTNAMENPDSLADVVGDNWLVDDIEAEASMGSIGCIAWQEVTGITDDLLYPVKSLDSELLGEDIDFDNEEAMQRLLPRLYKLLMI